MKRVDLTRAHAALAAGNAGEAAGICTDLLRRAGLADEVKREIQQLRLQAASRLGGIAHAIDLLEWSTRASPGNPIWLGMLSDLYRLAGRLDDALLIATEVARLQPSQTGPLLALARLHNDRGEIAAAADCFVAAIGVEPLNAIAHFGLAQMLLLRGEYRAGWAEYEWRHQLDAAKPLRPRLRLPQWNGMNLPDGHLALHTDQGYGDAFQFARYIPAVCARVGRVSLCCETPCLSLFRRIPGLELVTDDWNAIVDATAQTTLTSLPGIFGTTLENIPAVVPYLSAEPERVAAWRRRFAQMAPGGEMRIGLSWAGNPTHGNDANRSVPFGALAGLAGLPGARFFSIQKGLRPGDEAGMRAFPNLIDVAPEIANFDDTAAAIANLDVVVSICSSVTHLSGSLGRPVWVMLGHAAEWRWMTNREDSPWYPTARLFRQPRAGDWVSVASAILDGLERLMVERKAEPAR